MHLQDEDFDCVAKGQCLLAFSCRNGLAKVCKSTLLLLLFLSFSIFLSLLLFLVVVVVVLFMFLSFFLF